MLHTLDAAGEVTVSNPSDLIPLSLLALDLPAPEFGWDAYLTARDVLILRDDLGRPAVTRADARELLTEQREAETRQREQREAVEQRAVEADRQFRARLHPGIPAGQVPDGLSPAMAMVAANEGERPRRTTPLEEALSGSGLTFHPIQEEDDRWVVGGGDG